MLDPYGEGMVTFDDFRLAVEPGEALREMLDKELHSHADGSIKSTEAGFVLFYELLFLGFNETKMEEKHVFF